MRSSDSPICIANLGDLCGEGVLWRSDETSLYWVDNRRNLIHRYELSSRAIRTWLFDETVTSLAATTEPEILCVILGSRLLLWRPRTDERRSFGLPLQDWPEVRYNDSGVDPDGALWVGSMGNNMSVDGTKRAVAPKKGSIFRFTPDGRCSTVLKDLGVANTLVWSPRKTHFYSADSLRNTITSYSYKRSATALDHPRALLLNFPRGQPDGSAVDEEGSVWNCRYGGACVIRISPLGAVQRVVEMPTQNVTSCAFGGKDLKTLYVTTATSDRVATPFDGGLFAIETGVRGEPLREFRLPRSSSQ